ncbi:hypothetical protein I203_106901 [Kwoniella mangroviensis CBS 8507]|uniref:hypothetical protein n=1 Tax=Kwoniella mangroviensis CBS 8507 TaxID=1296122 RepID=UPI00305742A7
MSDPALPPFLKTSPPPTAPPSSARLHALYASTSSQRTTNPTGYAANSQWWASVIEETLRTGWINGESGDRLILKVDDALLGRLEDEHGRRPKGIGGVIEGLTLTTPPTLHPPSSLHIFFDTFACPPPDKVGKEETLWSRYGKGKEYVHIPLLEQFASSFTSHISKNPILSYTDALFDLDSFREEYGQICFPASPSSKKLPEGTHKLSIRDIEVLVKWLHRDCGVIVTDGSVIKVLEPDQMPSDHPITDADRGVISVINAQRKVEKQILGIEEQITQSQEKAKKQLAKGQKNAALSYLRSKKQLEDLLAKRIASSEQLGAVIRSIDQAKGDVEIMAAYETSTSTLRSVLSDPSLSPDRISATTDALAEAMADQEEIDQAVRIGGELAMGGKRVEVDENELAAELEDLVQEEKVAQAAAKEQQKKQVEKERQEKTDETAGRQSIPVNEKPTVLLPAQGQVAKSQQNFAQHDQSTNQQKEEQVWKDRYEDAQHRKEAERRRSEEERLRKGEKRLVAE